MATVTRRRNAALSVLRNFLVQRAGIIPAQEHGTAPITWRGVTFYLSAMHPGRAIEEHKGFGRQDGEDILVCMNAKQNGDTARAWVPLPLLAEFMKAYDSARRGDTE